MTFSLNRTTLILSFFLSLLVSCWIMLSTSVLQQTGNIMLLERDVYFRTAVSAVEDGDLNTFNQTPEKDRWLVSETHNFPDIRESGSFVAWVPFVLVSKLFHFDSLEDQKSNLLFAEAMGTLFFAGMSIFLTSQMLLIIFPGFGPTKKWLAFHFLTPVFLWYGLIEFSGSEIISNFFITAALYLLFQIDRKSSGRLAFLFGSGAALCLFIKLHILFYLPVLLVTLYFRTTFFNVLLSVLGFVCVSAIGLINVYLRFGFLDTPYSSIQSHFLNHFSQQISLLVNFIGANGIFSVNPTMGLGMAAIFIIGSQTSYFDKSSHFLVKAASAALWMTLIATSFRPVTEELLGGRQLLGQYIFVILSASFFAYHFSLQRSKIVSHMLAFSVCWTFVVCTSLFSSKNKAFLNGYWLYPPDIIIAWERVVQAFSQLHFTSYKVLLCWFAFVWGGALFTLSSKSRFFDRRFFAKYSLVFALLIFSVATVFNLALNQHNVKKDMENGLYQNISIGRCMNIFLWDDVLSAMKNVRIRWQQKHPEYLQSVDNFEQAFAQEAIKCLAVDKHSIQENFKNGIIRPPTGF